MSEQEDVERLERQLAALAVTVDRLDRAEQDQRAVNKWLHDQLTGLGAEMIKVIQRLGRPRAGDEEEPTAPVEWLTIADPDLAASTLTELHEWVERVWIPYGRLDDCWAWHPPVVAELLACRSAWLAAFAPEAPRQAPAEWHTRLRPSAAAHATHRMAMCDLTVHRGPNDAEYDPPDLTQLELYARWWASMPPRTPIPPGLNPRVPIVGGVR